MNRYFEWKNKAATVVVASMVLAILGPFGTYNTLSFLPRLLFWLGAVSAVGIPVNCCIYLIGVSGWGLDRPAVVSILSGAFLGSIPGALILALFYFQMNEFEFGWLSFGKMMILVSTISVVIGLSEFKIYEFNRNLPKNNPSQTSSLDCNAFFSRVSPELGRSLVSLSKQDHYLEVVTDKGSEVILLRMADAVAELAAYNGIRVHRSHWVAIDAIVGFERRDSRCFVLLKGGREVPVSRPNVTYVRGLAASVNSGGG
ncbi:LytTR family DNA-binding domain-containing protein [Cochlodiniinecator piscidefendens]|uniref:LytTR family DNA-binding domain-containing protein n=1 Tax=Cochlodiniinecator piscidefendens TaxID=2715756 RepID=UPI00140C4F28|nr:LytTR family DNA-binding domain-containing protein [Cochlodiniinecator piscidefendens]